MLRSLLLLLAVGASAFAPVSQRASSSVPLAAAPPTGASRRSEAMASFKVMEVLTKANNLEATGVDVLHMEVGQPATSAPPSARRAAEAALGRDEAMGYTNPNGLPDVAARIARWYEERHGSVVDPRRVVVTTGSSAGFILGFLALFDSGDKVGVPSTAYPCYRNLLRAFGCEAVPLAGDPDDPRSGFGFPTPGDVAAAAGDGVRGLILSSPSNPTGAALDAGELEALATACAAHDVRFISDEIYHHITYGDDASPSAVDLPGALVVNSFSKYFSMTGWRIGWLVLPEGDDVLAGAVERLQQNLFINAPTVSQIAACAAFDDVDADLEGHVARYEKSRAIVLDGLEAIGIDPNHIAPAKGAFYVYVDLGAYGVTDSLSLCNKLLEDEGVAITPGVDFEFEERVGLRRVRISYCGDADDIQAAMDRLKRWWDAGNYKL